MAYRNIVDLMQVSEEVRDIQWLQESLINAVQLELATLPPYLSAYWSIKDSTEKAATFINDIFFDEMKHMGLAANMLVSVGGVPQIDTAVPRYPGPLPGGVHPGLIVHLQGITKDYVQNVCMQIELPENPLAKAVTFTTIGAFYDAIAAAFTALNPPISLTNQQASSIGVTKITTVADALKAIELIKVEGEGTTDSPDDSPGDLAHYYKFGSIYYGKEIVKKGNQWVWEGADVPFPDAFPMAPVPAGGWANAPGVPANVKDLLTEFNGAYKNVLVGLQKAWTGQGSLGAAVGAMFNLQSPAQSLMQIAIGGGTAGNYGPDFVV